jgi:hypothetical protein
MKSGFRPVPIPASGLGGKMSLFIINEPVDNVRLTLANITVQLFRFANGSWNHSQKQRGKNRNYGYNAQKFHQSKGSVFYEVHGTSSRLTIQS